MESNALKPKVTEICGEIRQRIDRAHLQCFTGYDRPLLLISTTYPGLWLEHVYDAVCFAKLYPEYLPIAVNTIDLFVTHQTAEGQYPCYFWDINRVKCAPEETLGYGQTQECVSFAALALEVCRMTGDPALTARVYESAARWDGWLRRYRMTQGTGLVEMFVGFDSGHDNSGRLNGMHFPGNRRIDGRVVNAAMVPEADDCAPIGAVDMTCNLFATDTALAELTEMLGRTDEAAAWTARAQALKAALFTHCWNAGDAFFYDIDRHGVQRKYRSSTILHLFLEHVLDPAADKACSAEIAARHLFDPDEFWTPYPFPSMAVNDPSCAGHTDRNCWGYFSQALIALRCTRWMDDYGFSAAFDTLCRQFLAAWTDAYPRFCLGQELHPITGAPTPSSEWYSSCMIFYLYAAKRLGLYTE